MRHIWLIAAASARLQSAAVSQTFDLSEVLNVWYKLPASELEEVSTVRLGESDFVVMDDTEDEGTLWAVETLPPNTSYELTLSFGWTGALDPTDPQSKFDGVGIWLINDTSLEYLSNGKYGDETDTVPHNILGFRGDYFGFGTFLSMSNRVNNIKPSVSCLFGNGQKQLTMGQVPTEFGIYWNFLQAPGFDVNMQVRNSTVLLRVRDVNGDYQGSWKDVIGVNGKSTVSGRLGITTTNKRDQGTSGVQLSLKKVTITSSDQNFIDNFGPHDIQLDSSEVPAPTAVDMDEVPVPVNDPEESHRAMMAMIKELREQQERIQRSILTLSKAVAGNKDTLQIQQALSDLKKDLQDTSDKSNPHDSIKSLQKNAESLESTVRKATTYSTYFAVGLSASFLGFAGMIYKRMKDMEKKHFL